MAPAAEAALAFTAGVPNLAASSVSSSAAARAPGRSPAASRISTCAGSTLTRYSALSVGARHDDRPGSVVARRIDSAAATTFPWASRSSESAGSVSWPRPWAPSNASSDPGRSPRRSLISPTWYSASPAAAGMNPRSSTDASRASASASGQAPCMRFTSERNRRHIPG